MSDERAASPAGETILLGAVAYDPKVVTIWEGIRAYFQDNGVKMDFALFSNYERQVESLLRGHVDIAWNTPLAHVRVKRRTEGKSRSLGMRDSDRDFHAKIVVRKDAGIRALTDLGKHGDTGTSELDVLAALADGRAQAGAVGDLVWVLEQAAGRIDAGKLEVLWTTPGFDHCMFDALPTIPQQKADAFTKALFAMRWDDPRHRKILEMEGLKQWMPPREEGYESLRRALDATNGW